MCTVKVLVHPFRKYNNNAYKSVYSHLGKFYIPVSNRIQKGIKKGGKKGFS